MNILIKQTSDSQFLHLKEQFQKLDKDGTGLITPQELKKYIDDNDDINVDDDEMEALI